MNTIRNFLAIIEELIKFLWTRKRWWLIPMIVLFLLISGLIILGSMTGIGPLIYTLF
jgi:hypothetical protein